MGNQKTNSVLLLCSQFSNQSGEDIKPLTPLEYGRLAKWLHERGRTPADLLLDLDQGIAGWVDPKKKITRERLKKLLGRSMALALALEKWERAGIWVVTRSDPAYPRRLKQRLEYGSPAFFYGVGNKRLLHAGGLAVVGSRGISASDKTYTNAIGRQAALDGLNVVSGGAKGVDETAMLGALSIEGTVIGVLGDGLLKAAVSSRWRDYLMRDQLVLVSPYYPEAGFSVGNAMGRNKYIYCLADYGLVVRADEGTGGTWNGAVENLKKHWVPLFVKTDSDAAGNAALIRLGAKALQFDTQDGGKAGEDPLRKLLSSIQEVNSIAPTKRVAVNGQGVAPKDAEQKPDDTPGMNIEEANVGETPEFEIYKAESATVVAKGADAFYAVFVEALRGRFGQHTEISLEDLIKDFPEIMPKQFNIWFDRAEQEELVVRKGKRRIYTLKEQSSQIEPGNLNLWGED